MARGWQTGARNHLKRRTSRDTRVLLVLFNQRASQRLRGTGSGSLISDCRLRGTQPVVSQGDWDTTSPPPPSLPSWPSQRFGPASGLPAAFSYPWRAHAAACRATASCPGPQRHLCGVRVLTCARRVCSAFPVPSPRGLRRSHPVPLPLGFLRAPHHLLEPAFRRDPLPKLCVFRFFVLCARMRV